MFDSIGNILLVVEGKNELACRDSLPNNRREARIICRLLDERMIGFRKLQLIMQCAVQEARGPFKQSKEWFVLLANADEPILEDSLTD